MSNPVWLLCVLCRFASPVRGAASMPLGLSRDHVAGRVAIMAGACIQALQDFA